MKSSISFRRLAAVGVTVGVIIGISGASAVAASAPVTRTFSFIAAPSSKTSTIVNIDSLLINARCSAGGSPIVFAFTSAPAADIFARVFDGFGRLHTMKNTSFTSKTKGLQLSPSSGDFNATGTVFFETLSGKVVTVNIAFDNSTTLVGRKLCTVFGSFIAT